MKIKSLVFMLALIIAPMYAHASADITLYYSPTCPHCHHARDFISNILIYEYPTLNAKMINLADESTRSEFMSVLKKCNYDKAYVPVIIANDKCFQGFDTVETSGIELRNALNAGLTDSEKSDAQTAAKAFNADADGYRSSNANRLNSIKEIGAQPINTADVSQKKTSGESGVYFYGLLIILVAGIGFILLSKKKK